MVVDSIECTLKSRRPFCLFPPPLRTTCATVQRCLWTPSCILKLCTCLLLFFLYLKTPSSKLTEAKGKKRVTTSTAKIDKSKKKQVLWTRHSKNYTVTEKQRNTNAVSKLKFPHKTLPHQIEQQQTGVDDRGGGPPWDWYLNPLLVSILLCRPLILYEGEGNKIRQVASTLSLVRSAFIRVGLATLFFT